LRALPALGNTDHNKSWFLNLPDGTYFWSVQAIDGSFAGSAFSTEGSFSIGDPFTDIAAGLAGVQYASVAWGDYDNDGDLDILLTGESLGGPTSIVYRNDEGVFIDIAAGLTGVERSSVCWGDYDNDGDLDILLTGDTGSGPASLIYRNDDGLFEDIGAGLTGVSESSVAWGDCDNDGDLDILLTGLDEGGDPISSICRNEAGLFTDIGAGLTGVSQSSVAWGDCDNDGDLDILLTGNGTGGLTALIYRNDEGVFTDIGAGLAGVYYSSAAWGDYDGDGDLDVLLAGFGAGGRISRIYLNDSGVFTDIGAGLIGVNRSCAAWGDCDNDGDLDILLAGYSDAGRVSLVYRNDDGSFIDIGAGLNAVYRCAAAWGDYDDDGDLDILLAGLNATIPSTGLYRNNSAVANTAPSAPDNLNSVVSDSLTCLTWDMASDDQTPAPSLTYRLRVGTTPGGSEICSPHALGSGQPTVAARGVANRNAYWVLALNPGTYYWSVQAIDAGFEGSMFATEVPFTVPNSTDAPPDLPERLMLYPPHPNPFNPATHLRFDLPEDERLILGIYDPSGRRIRVILDGRIDAGHHEMIWDGRNDRGLPMPSGVYLCRLQTETSTQARRLILLK